MLEYGTVLVPCYYIFRKIFAWFLYDSIQFKDDRRKENNVVLSLAQSARVLPYLGFNIRLRRSLIPSVVARRLANISICANSNSKGRSPERMVCSTKD